MKQIRENIYFLTHSELGRPTEPGTVEVAGLGTVRLDIADIRYVREHIEKGYEPAFFVSHSPALGGDLIVVSRQHAA